MQSPQQFALVALTPPGLLEPGIAIAASRAGGIGILDLEYIRDLQTARKAVEKLGKYTRGHCGLKLVGEPEIFESLLSHGLPPPVEFVVLIPTHPEVLPEQIVDLRNRGRKVFLEVTGTAEARLAVDLGVDGLLAKGNEAGGRVGSETSFILLQRLQKETRLPIWVQGGIGLHTVTACYLAGAAGVVLDAQLALTRESPLPEAARAAIARMDGSETIHIGNDLGADYHVYNRPDLKPLERLNRLANSHEGQQPVDLNTWREEISQLVGWANPETQVWLLGQDAACAARYGRQFKTVAGVFEALRNSMTDHLHTAQKLRPLEPEAPLARSHGTRYPIVQGPMTRVSDRADFILEVAKGGALPFVALALMRAPEATALLIETRRKLGDRPWGVGILGFVPLELRQEQLKVIQEQRPAFALIAGGRPDQALQLEQAGVPTYLHVPSPRLLHLFIESGARRFVFEGRECGGHVGPRTSFVLWETMIETLLETMPPAEMPDCHVLFAGGIHDNLSAAMVTAMAAPLAGRGARIGVLMGTAYLFTQEAVASGSIQPSFQQEAIACDETVLLETGPGHSTRCARTPFTDQFNIERQRLVRLGKTTEEIRRSLEELNLGRLRIASKGISRNPTWEANTNIPKYLTLEEAQQRQQGMYMMGQLAVLRDRICTIQELHEEVSSAGTRRLLACELPEPASPAARQAETPSSVAIVGMACILPGAANLQAYWENILNKVDAIREIPAERFDWQRYYDPDRRVPDKIYSKWGGFLDEIPFDPGRYGMPPNSLASIEPLQLLVLEVVRAALADAGYEQRPFPRKHTSVIIGAGGGVADMGNQYAVRASLPMLFGEVPPYILDRLPEWTEDSFPGILLNVVAGRVANRFDFGGVNYTVDAACASSLAAVHLAVRELEAGTSDVVIVGGGETVQNPFGYLAFSKTQALSPRGRCSTFDESADGIAISEGVAVLMLKRLADAERDGDNIYAVIKAVAGSSDGRDRGLTAPRPEGQVLALERAYARAGFSPASVELVEAHGTGTVVGDQAEVETLKRIFESAGASGQNCAIGSVKSMIGHTKCAAGLAGMIKVTLSLHHKVLPPTLHVERPNPKARFRESPFYVNSELRPWIQSLSGLPRRAGVSAFGFGGTNFHAVLEEYSDSFLESDHKAIARTWPCELFILSGRDPADLLASISVLETTLERGARPALADLAYSLWQGARAKHGMRLALVATSLEDLRDKFALARETLDRGGSDLQDARGVYFTYRPLAREGKVAFLFPGQGSQYPGMLSDLAVTFPEVRKCFEAADRALALRFPERLSAYIFPPPAFTPEEQRERQAALTQTHIAQPALGVSSLGLLSLLLELDLQPALTAGHSYGEYVALCCAGVFNEETLYRLSEARGRCILEAAGEDLGTMAAASESRERVEEILASIPEVWIANVNSPQQTVISGTQVGTAAAVEKLKQVGISARALPVACAFHSPLVAPARDRLAGVLADVEFHTPLNPVFSNATAGPYPKDPSAIAALLTDHLTSPVRFRDEIEAMYAAGARLFVEVGPRNVLTALTGQILMDRPHLAVATDAAGRPGLLQLLHALGQLLAHGAEINLDRIFQGRSTRILQPDTLEEALRPAPLPKTTWMVNGGKARPLYPTGPVRTSSTPPAPSQAAAAATLPANGSKAPSINSLASATSSPAVHSPPNSNGKSSAAQPAGAEAVMLQFQQLMGRFLETQQSVLKAYLQGANVEGVENPELGYPHSTEPAVIPTSMEPPAAAQPPQSGPESELAPTGDPSVRLLSLDNQEGITRILLQLVADRTGYPVDMLNPDINLEADLGIDSIKRVEILSTFQQGYLLPGQPSLQGMMDGLNEVKTIRAMVELLKAASPPGALGPVAQGREALSQAIPAGDPDTQRPNPTLGEVDLPRFLLAPIPISPAGKKSLDIAGRLFLITEDRSGGIASILADALRQRGGRVALLRLTPTGVEPSNSLYAADLLDPRSLASTLETIRRDLGLISGLIHLRPLGEESIARGDGLAGWENQARQEVTGFFQLIQALAPDLKQAAASGGAWLLVAAALADGESGYQLRFPGDGGLAGLVKTLRLEWQQALPEARLVGLETNADPILLAEFLLQELGASDEEPEVFYRREQRFNLGLKAASLEASPPGLDIKPDWVILVTGGARGITAEVAHVLATGYRPTLILAGRSSLPSAEENPRTAGLSSLPDLKSALIESLRRDGQPATPAQVEAAYTRLLQDREIRQNLAALQEAGARVEYFPVDVRDEAAFSALIDTLYQKYGRIDGVIHGAGVIEDRLIEAKTLESFQRVFDTKVASAFTLAQKLRPESLQFLVFFSSISGRFGNRGQADYAAANEVLNKLAVTLDERWPGRVIALNWGPWEKTGMVSEGVQRQFAERGLRLIQPEIGVRAFDRELRFGHKGETEIVLGSGPWETVKSNDTFKERI